MDDLLQSNECPLEAKIQRKEDNAHNHRQPLKQRHPFQRKLRELQEKGNDVISLL